MNNISRELFIPKMRKVFYTNAELEKFVQLYDGKKNIYNSVYRYNGEPNANNAIIDKIFLDFDYDDDLIFLSHVRKVAQYLKDLNVQYYIRFSGRGFHIFVLIKPALKNSKTAIRNWVDELHKKTKTTSDMSVVGDTRRVSRTLYTKNLKTKLYCIPLQYADLMTLSYYEICNMAKNPQKNIINNIYNCYYTIYDFINGNDLLDLSGYFEIESEIKQQIPIKISDIKVDVDFPPCIKKLLQTSTLGWNERRELIIYLRDDGYGYDEIVSLLKKTLTPEKFYHCVYEEHQVDYLLGREDILFSSCKTQKLNHICASDNCPGNNLYL